MATDEQIAIEWDTVDPFLFDFLDEHSTNPDELDQTFFNDAHHRMQRDAYVRGETIRPDLWPGSFQRCTSALRMCPHTRIDHDASLLCVGQFVDRWIAEEFTRPNSAKCLILIGESDKGPFSKGETREAVRHTFTIFSE